MVSDDWRNRAEKWYVEFRLRGRGQGKKKSQPPRKHFIASLLRCTHSTEASCTRARGRLHIYNWEHHWVCFVDTIFKKVTHFQRTTFWIHVFKTCFTPKVEDSVFLVLLLWCKVEDFFTVWLDQSIYFHMQLFIYKKKCFILFPWPTDSF